MTWFHSQEKSLVWFGGCFMWTGEGIIHHHIPLYPIISPILVVIFPWYPHIGVYIASISPYWWLNLTILFGDGDPEIRRSKRPWRSRPLAFEQFLVVALAVKTKGKKLGKKYDYYIYIYMYKFYKNTMLSRHFFWTEELLGLFSEAGNGEFSMGPFCCNFSRTQSAAPKVMGDISTPKSPKINTFWVENPKTWGYSCFGKDPPFLCGMPLEPSLEQLRLGPTVLELSSGGWNLALHFYFFVILPKKIEQYNRDNLPSGKLTVCYWKWPIYSWFTYTKWWFSIVMLVYQRVLFYLFGGCCIRSSSPNLRPRLKQEFFGLFQLGSCFGMFWNTLHFWTRSKFHKSRALQKIEIRSTSFWCFTYGYGSIPIDTFLVGWTSIYQLFWGSRGTRVLIHPHISIWKNP